jgi:glycosyltransferase involved in cell wall biosynthesis
MAVSLGVYIAVRNHGSTLGRAIESAVNAGINEIFVMDDASEDSTHDVLTEMQSRHPDVITSVRLAEKSLDHQQALSQHFPSMSSTHLIGMGADDYLLPEIADVREFLAAPLVFCDFAHVSFDGSVLKTSWCEYSLPVSLSAAGVRERLKYCQRHECGIGSAVRRDLLEWLYIEQEAWRLGAWSDSIGLSMLAAMHGATYLPGDRAAFTVVPQGGPSYHQQHVHNDESRASAARESKRLLGQHVDADTAGRILERWFS